MTPQMNEEYAVEVCRKHEYTIVLPRQSPLGIFGGSVRQPMGKWPASFLCIYCGHLYEYSPSDVQHPFQGKLDQDLLRPDLWQADYVCGHENCGKTRKVYFSYEAGAPEADVEVRIAHIAAIFPCSEDHGASLQKGKLTICERFPQ